MSDFFFPTLLKSTMLLFFIVPLITVGVAITSKFVDITYDMFPVNPGIIAAFGHFNSDEYTDIFSLQQGGTKLQIFVFSETDQQFQPYANCSSGNVITSIVPGDFNGDSVMDVLIILKTAPDSSENDVKILWGNDGNIDCKSATLFTIVNQPLVVDFNGDMIPDIIAETKTGEKYVWFFSHEKTFTNNTFPKIQKFGYPHSSGLIDINDDLAADILIMGENCIEIGINDGEEFRFNKQIPYPKITSDHIRFQSTFVDLNLDGQLDIVMPVCNNPKCDASSIFIWNRNSSEWKLILDNIKHQNVSWGFKLPEGLPLDVAALPVTLRAGDIDMDGYPDFLVILEAKSTHHKSKPVIIKNNPCVNCTHCVLDRCLEILWDIPGLYDIPNVEIAAFFDIFEDGVLDIFISSKDHEWKSYALKNSESPDFCFMKVLVLNGLCDSCSGHMRYGVNQPGPIVQYNITKEDGHPLVSSAVQMSQTAYFPLLLPYSIFGLGQTPNFIDALTIAVPAKFIKSVHKREWTQIIPNSQIVVIPHPPQDENKWVKNLFVTPSHYVLLTCIALLGTCTFISIIVAVLHWREKKEDKKEKMQDACRFHFDAM